VPVPAPVPAAPSAPLPRAERKERTRRAILDATLRLAEEQTLGTVSLRQVAKEVGIVPTAFYRHFASLDDVGLELVEEALGALRGMLRDVRRGAAADLESLTQVTDRSVDVLVDHVSRGRSHFLFVARERVAGPPPVREAIRHGIELFERELATDVARIPGTEGWSTDDLRTLSRLIVSSMVTTAEEMVHAAGRPGAAAQVEADARTQLRMVLVGALNWRSEAD
jgi:AcrR family transcriptional regulator